VEAQAPKQNEHVNVKSSVFQIEGLCLVEGCCIRKILALCYKHSQQAFEA